MFLELEGFIFALSMEMLEGFILALLLNSHVQVVKSWKVLSLLLELEDFILAFGAGRFYPRSSMDALKGFILALLLEATGEKRKD